MARSRYGTRRVRDIPSIERDVDNADLVDRVKSAESTGGASGVALEDKLRLENLGMSSLLQIEDLKRNLSELEEKVRHIEQVAVNSVRNDGHPQFHNVKTTTIQKTIVSKSASHAVVAGEGSVYIGNAAGGAVTFTLPVVASCIGLVLTFKKIDSSGNAVIVDGNASETIDGATTKSIGTQYHSITIISNGTGWSIIGELD